ncbi:2-amino-4-hydroxy-6-hydroxymethyldihydropteridine diphosphokinase [Halalkaliarchaeum desulfuricum]|uniref:6-hydroxymethyl-7,8-dihydropterin pyrophosphokinase n=1 Tax=Halalkaliarchaeum desulfuricum TaxID=2055893 RepID=A0A343TKS7_9EURY|nr:6-hydroxymethylpterin diphosphokinase MptE-like protein [Halalkaliarchaeum desulfuricum]AUX09699.1 2-amino-4-hydroxy-6-hydroxymethyldihydropteridine diphosphokinase [Halalkaliarchaeum desulfuricum]
MEFSEWEPVYEAILADFGFDRVADERARDVAATYATPVDFSVLAEAVGVAGGKTVAIVGAAPSLSAELDTFDPESVDAVFAASTAADTLLGADLPVDCLVTDLDKNPETAARLTREETLVAAHAHGDNVEMVRRFLPEFDPSSTLVTTQAEPVDAVYNLGGFTDGDRAAFLADALGAGELRFLGWEFDDTSVGPVKAKKLRWAERLLFWLEQRRNERFGVLDGRRSGIEQIPV